MYIKISSMRGIKYVNIVEGYRVGKSVKHRSIANLGRLDVLEATGGLQVLGNRLLQLAGITMQAQLGEDSTSEGEILNYGYIVYRNMWKRLELDSLMSALKAKHSRQTYDLNNVTFRTSVQRLLDPVSKKATYDNQETFYGLPRVELQHIYRSLEVLAEHKDEIENHLFQKTAQMRSSMDIVFYDVTTFAFQSVVKDEIRDFGFSKDQKFKDVQVVLGLFMDKDGYPIGYELFKGNTFDSKTLMTMLHGLKKKFKIRRIVIVADRGINSKANLLHIKEAGYEYIVASKIKSMDGRTIKNILSEEGFVVSAQKDPKSEEIFKHKVLDYSNYVVDADNKKVTLAEKLVVTYSSKRARKDEADRNRLIEKANKLLEDPSSINQQFQRGGKAYIKKIDVKKYTYCLNTDKIAEDAKYDGFYAMQCSDSNLSAQEVMDAYHSLCRIEDCFRTMKGSLAVRPIFHWTEKRIKGHFVSCYIAFLMERMIEIPLKKQGVVVSPDAIQNAVASAVVCRFTSGDKEYFINCKNQVRDSDNLLTKIFRIAKCNKPKAINSKEEMMRIVV